MKRVGIFLLICVCAHYTNCAKILAIFPFPARSHYILGNALAKGLAEQGHDVTMLSTFADKTPPKKGTFRQIVLKEILEEHQAKIDSKEFNMFEMGDQNIFIMLFFMYTMMSDSIEQFFNQTQVQTLLKSNEKYDVVIVEQFFLEAQKGFAQHFDAPLITLNTLGANTWSNQLLGNPGPPSYIPDALLSYSSKMTFCERLFNSVFKLYTEVLTHCYLFPMHKKVYDKHFSNGPAFYDVLYNTSILLLNSHPSSNQPVPYVPNMIDIGGFHVQPPKQLPKDLQEFLDNATEGVIYFSMGSNLRSIHLPLEKREAFLKTFAKLKQKVLWKWEDDVLPGQPPNVKLGKWLPQQDILAHPNVKLFITHGGLLSTIETIYHGVPVLSIPVTADQKLNAQNVDNQGYGVMIPYNEVTEETLTKQLQEVLTHDKYSKMAKKRSEIFHDRIVSPLDTAIYWVEYVIRHRGAPHLQVAGVHLPWYQYHLVDVILFIAAISTGFVFLFYILIKKCVCLLCSKKKPKVKKN